MKFSIKHKFIPGWNYDSYEPQTTSFYQDTIKNDWVVYDIGARDGYFTLLFAELAHEVHSFEPTEYIECLRKNVSEYNISNVVSNQMATGAKSGNRVDGIFKDWGRDAEIKNYEFTTLDDYTIITDPERIDLIKIDVDSYEMETILGAENLLAVYKPIVVCELNRDALSRRQHTPEEVINQMAQWNYTHHGVVDGENHMFTNEK